MSSKPVAPKTRLYLSSVTVLLIGLTLSAVIYLTAGPPDANPLGNPLDESKSYRRSLEMYGGKANLLASEFTDWFQSLWHGRSLGITLAVATIVVAAGIALFAHYTPPDEQ